MVGEAVGSLSAIRLRRVSLGCRPGVGSRSLGSLVSTGTDGSATRGDGLGYWADSSGGSNKILKNAGNHRGIDFFYLILQVE